MRCEKHELKVFLIVLSQCAANKTDSNLMKNCICNLFPLFYSVKMQNFNSRLETFKEWPNTNVKPEDLANAGFFYTGTIWKCKLLSPIFYLHYLSPLIYGYFNRTHQSDLTIEKKKFTSLGYSILVFYFLCSQMYACQSPFTLSQYKRILACLV